MKNEKNPPEPISNLQTFFAFLQEMLVKFFDFVADVWRKSGNIAQTNYEFGRRLMSQGNLLDAALRFRLATWLNPKHLQAWYHLGQCELARGKRTEAIKAFRRAYVLSHAHEENRYMLAFLDPASMMGEPQPTAMPVSLVTLQFDAASREYNIRQQKMGYRGHIQLAESLFAALPPEANDLVIVDLGCGSGLAGLLLRPRARHLTGVDASKGMLREADRLFDEDGKPIYDLLMYMDLRKYLAMPTSVPFDVIMAANVLGYVGDLTGVFDSVNTVLAPGGLFGFSTLVSQGPGFHIVPGVGHFSHSLDYLRAQAARHGWQEISCEDVILAPKEKAVQLVYKVSGG